MISFKHSGSFSNIEKFLRSNKKNDQLVSILDKYGRQGVDALKSATPVDTGKTADSWDYEVVIKDGKANVYWTNSNVNDGVPIALIIQLGHGTKNGGYIQGVDYINPAIKPILDKIADSAWEEVTK